jgi:hypothetical protein
MSYGPLRRMGSVRWRNRYHLDRDHEPGLLSRSLGPSPAISSSRQEPSPTAHQRRPVQWRRQAGCCVRHASRSATWYLAPPDGLRPPTPYWRPATDRGPCSGAEFPRTPPLSMECPEFVVPNMLLKSLHPVRPSSHLASHGPSRGRSSAERQLGASTLAAEPPEPQPPSPSDSERVAPLLSSPTAQLDRPAQPRLESRHRNALPVAGDAWAGEHATFV